MSQERPSHDIQRGILKSGESQRTTLRVKFGQVERQKIQPKAKTSRKELVVKKIHPQVCCQF